MASKTCSTSYSAELDPGFLRVRRCEKKRLCGWQRREGRRCLRALAGAESLHGLAQHVGSLGTQIVDAGHLKILKDHIFLAYERVVYPCQNMNCGDVVYRSSLDPVLRLEQRGINPIAVAIIALALIYLTATPGVLQGAIDYYILDKYQRLTQTKPYDEDSFVMGKKLAQGGFGTVYRGQLKEENGDLTEVVIKRAKEFGEAEVWMNERLMRAAPGQFAEFVTAFEETQTTKQKAKLKRRNEPIPLWLVWKFEGDFTLWNLMVKKEFPYNVEPIIYGKELRSRKGAKRSLRTIKAVMLELLKGLKASHATGIVHRDIKPQNVIISETDAKAKLIDLGAAADLRVGINYVPNEYLLDPRYAPPEQYIMSTSTPRAPPVPVAATLSPILWRLNNPDRFDMYSVGVTLIQMVFAPLRNDNALIALRNLLSEQYNSDLEKWRSAILAKKTLSRDYAEGFQMMDMDNGALWDLTKRLMAYDPSKRLSAAAALRHEAFGRGAVGQLNVVLAKASAAVDKVVTDNNWITDSIAKATGLNEGLSEAQLSEELGGREMPQGLRASKTISWWQQRQMAFERANLGKQAKAEREKRRQGSQGTDIINIRRNGSGPSSSDSGSGPSNGSSSDASNESDTRILGKFFSLK